MKVKLPESLQNSKTLYKLEKLMTTQRELVEELRLDNVLQKDNYNYAEPTQDYIMPTTWTTMYLSVPPYIM